MSNHFTYEIDERNLRVQLKGIESPVKEEAWQRFETFLNSRVDPYREKKIRSFQITLNRNVVLPVAFGIMIVFFSFLLFNFINIKDPQKTESLKSEPQKETIIIKPELRQNTDAGIPINSNSQLKSEPRNIVAIKAPDVKITTDAKSQSEKSGIPAAKIPMPVTVNAAIQVDQPVEKTETTRKIRKKRAEEIVESEHLPDIRADLNAEEREQEIRPN